eukprot:m.164044 g.164044  ORF g.164044 m.164044 type:complete len:50 (+) comp15225_c1_seq5:194-343(+)
MKAEAIHLRTLEEITARVFVPSNVTTYIQYKSLQVGILQFSFNARSGWE